MKREEILNKFYENDVLKSAENNFNEFLLYTNENNENILNEFQNFLTYMNNETFNYQKENDFKVAFISFSFLRTKALLNSSYSYLVEVYEKEWIYGKNKLSFCYDVGFIDKFILNLKEELSFEKKKYVNKVYPMDVDIAILKELNKYNKVLKEMFYSFFRSYGNNAFSNIQKNVDFVVMIGEYGDKLKYPHEIIYREDLREKESDDIKYLMENKDALFYFDSFKNLNLSNGNYMNLRAPYCDFSGSDFSNSNFNNAFLINCNFSGCNLLGASFDGANVEGSVF